MPRRPIRPTRQAADAKPSGAPAPGHSLTAQDVLEKMAAAYRSASTYEDFATAELSEPGSTEPRRVNFSVAFERPNKLRMSSIRARSFVTERSGLPSRKDIPGQAVLRDAPEKIKLPMLQADPVLNQVLSFAGGSPQLLLLLEEKPLAMLLEGVRDQDLTLLDEPGRIGDYDCYRVRFNRNDGAGEYWIDQKTFVLRRVRFRQSSRAARAGRATRRRKLSAWWPISSGPGWEAHRSIPWPSSSKCPTACNAVVRWWTRALRVDRQESARLSTCRHARQTVEQSVAAWKGGRAPLVAKQRRGLSARHSCSPAGLRQVQGQRKSGCLGVNLDGPQVEAKTIEETARQWKLSVPILRDADLEIPKLLQTFGAAGHVLHGCQGRAPGLHRRRQSPGRRRDDAQAGEPAGRRGACRTGVGEVPAAGKTR